jgi:HlyD family secretion protein
MYIMNRKKILKIAVLLFLTIDAVLLLIIFFGARQGKKASAGAYEFTVVQRGNLERTVSSSGTINPVSTVKVIPQMSGKVEKIFVDYNAPVRRGDILAELNTDVLKLKYEQQLASHKKAKANYELQLINYRSQETLAEKNLISAYELKTGKTTLDNQAADLAVAEANLKVIETEINQYAFIKSPIDGIVLDRRINAGDTVVDSSSSNSSAIFTLAENLREMQIEAGAGELDVAFIHAGQPVRFSLESLPGRRFSGVVETLRLIPSIVNGIVSYTVIIKVENEDGSLLPGMTCAVDFIVERSENVLMISNAALRYEPVSVRAQSSQNTNPAANTGLAGLVMGQRVMGGGNRQQGQNQTRVSRRETVIRNLWFISSDGKLEVLQVETGISNGAFTEIRGMEDIEGRQFILRDKI